MAISTKDVGGVTVLEISGNVTIGKGDIELREAFKTALDGGARKFLFDLRGVRFMDSAGIGETAACAKRAHEVDSEIKIVLTPKGKAEEVLKIAWLDRVFDIYYDEGDALKSLGTMR